MTSIEWTHIPGFKGESWNPVVGCSLASPGCSGCYAMGEAERIQRMTKGRTGNAADTHYFGTTKIVKGNPVWTGKVVAAPDHIVTKPLTWAGPRAVFVNSMGDLFHEDVPDEWIDRVFAVMALCPQHIFMVLTKRSDRMRAYLNNDPRDVINSHAGVMMHWDDMPERADWPMSNVWLGVSVEDQARADERIPDLLAAAVRFVSQEPALEPVDFNTAWHGEDALDPECCRDCGWCEQGYPPLWNCRRQESPDLARGRSGLDWIITGGESGPNARPMHPDIPRSTRDQCAAAGVPFFFKQWGEWAPVDVDADGCYRNAATGDAGSPLVKFGTTPEYRHGPGRPSAISYRVGKKAAGHLLDGVEHHNWPEIPGNMGRGFRAGSGPSPAEGKKTNQKGPTS